MIWQFYMWMVQVSRVHSMVPLVQVSREAGVDCALAELYTKSLAIEGTIQEQKHAEVLTKLYVRMNEVSSAETSRISYSVCVPKGWWVVMHSKCNAAMLTTADCAMG